MASGARWVQLDTAAIQAKVRHHSWAGAFGNWLLQQSDHFGRNNTVQGGLQRCLIALRAYFHVSAHIENSACQARPVTAACEENEEGDLNNAGRQS